MTTPPRIYQLFVRLFGNTKGVNAYDGTIATNGVGRFVDINDDTLTQLTSLGITHLWLTGIVRHATLTDYSQIDPALSADPPDIVKGRAGSPYAITDYYDVAPDLAVEPAQRRAEFGALLARIHAHGLRALIDFVPNHVSRAYASRIRPETTFGLHDDRTQFFSAQNSFFYLVSPPAQVLRLSYPAGAPPREGLTGTFAREAIPKATANNQTSPRPSAEDWYEAVKLNYGYNFVDGSTHYDPIPRTWQQMDDILAYWQAMGVDGFRCDFAHWIPVEFWSWAIGRAKARQPTYFFGEAYDNPDSPPGYSAAALVRAGFDSLYDYQLYNGVKGIFAAGKWCNDLDALLPEPALLGHRVRYAENHDECRAAAPLRDGDPGNSGFGSKEEGFAVTALLHALGPDPTLLYNGQEVGEPGAGRKGFGGEDGRSSIFDYWTMPAVARWLKDHAYEGTLRERYAELARLLNEPAFAQGQLCSVQSANKDATSYGGGGQWVYGYLRFHAASKQSFLVLVNLNPDNSFAPSVRIPRATMNLTPLADATAVALADAFSSFTAHGTPESGIEIPLPPATVRMLKMTSA